MRRAHLAPPGPCCFSHLGRSYGGPPYGGGYGGGGYGGGGYGGGYGAPRCALLRCLPP